MKKLLYYFLFGYCNYKAVVFDKKSGLYHYFLNVLDDYQGGNLE